MKGVILAGGFGTRLRPLTHITNKHLLPIYNRPMLSYPLETLLRGGIRDILIVTEQGSLAAVKKYFGEGERWGARLSYQPQTGAGGIAAALRLAQPFVGRELVVMILGDNIFDPAFVPAIQSFTAGATVFLKKMPRDLERFGVPVLAQGKIRSIEEKPQQPKSAYAATGLYFFDSTVFSIIDQLRPSARGELEITDVLNVYARESRLRHEFVKGYWADAGTFESLLGASRWMQKQNPKSQAPNNK